LTEEWDNKEKQQSNGITMGLLIMLIVFTIGFIIGVFWGLSWADWEAPNPEFVPRMITNVYNTL